ncbi:DUF2790 domain-containing protein [Pseudomonas putida]|uniref:DUF2790 domain-containing protein n=1 Tax=Pseudomonas putida TaxID=303 RepID=UPI001E65240D|nr:DUF2790 domain-containing protein [Pseudomonas putida]MCE0961512.1 DUF2790 domain-containing protein [Pseudomonas putida]
MKALFALILGGLCNVAMATDVEQQVEQAPVEQYSYSRHLDIARVISMSQVPDVCEVVPARMTYEDSQRNEHVLEYRVMGNGCSNN